MTITITWEGLLLTALALAGAVLLIYLIVLVSNLIKTVKKANDILDDAKVVSEITADKAQKLDGIIDGVSESVSDVAETLKGNKNIISAATNVVNAVSNLAGMAKAADRKKDKKLKRRKMTDESNRNHQAGRSPWTSGNTGRIEKKPWNKNR